MKILVTGMTLRQTDSGNRLYDYVTNAIVFPNALREAGFQVDQRPVIPGEDLSAYEHVIVYIGPPNSMSSVHVFGALWALHARPDAEIAISDWQMQPVVSGFRTTLKYGWDKLYMNPEQYPRFPRRHREEAIAHQDALMSVVRRFVEDTWPRCYVCAWDWGDVTKLRLPCKEIRQFDPSSMCWNLYENKGYEKGRGWVYCSLLDRQSWLERVSEGAEWPIFQYGNKRLGQLWLPEARLFDVMSRYWGYCAPPHDHHGSGWWRIRFILAASAGCVTVGKESFGPAFNLLGDPPRLADVERMSDLTLAQTAEAQRLELEQSCWSKQRLLGQLVEWFGVNGGAAERSRATDTIRSEDSAVVLS